MSEWSAANKSSAEKRTTGDEANQVSIITVENFPANFDRGIGTRRACLVGLALAWILGATLLAAGAYLCSVPQSSRNRSNQSLSFSSSTPAYVPELLPLAFNIIITLINETVGYTHTACLRWALQTENRLEFNSNLRLLSNSRTSRANKWYSNIIFIICLALSYSTSAQLLQYTNDPSALDSSSSASSQPAAPTILALNSVALTTLGLALLGQAAIATWAYYTNTIPTWSSSPLDTLKAAQEVGNLQHVTGRCMRSVDQKNEPSVPALPRPHQCSAWSAHKEVRWVLLLLCALLPLGGIWVGVCYNVFNGADSADSSGSFTNWAFLPTDETHTTSGSPYIALSWNNVNVYIVSAETLAFFTGLQAIITLALHCVELLANLSRDEAIWRRATTAPGLKVSIYNSVTAALTAWQTVMLFIFKAAIHWMFGLSVAISPGILLHPIQMVYLMILVAVLAALTIYIATRRPSGPQPAAYGHLQTMADLVDEWAPTMYWGDKSISGVYHAGTSSSVLGDVDLNCLYS